MKFLVNELGYQIQKIQFPKNRNSFFQRDYFHRVSTITFNITFQKWLAGNNYEFLFFHSYFNKSKASNYRKAITALPIEKQRIEPD